jgi:PmbA protein
MGYDVSAILERALLAARPDEADALVIATDRNISRFANSNIHQNMSETTGELSLRVVVNDAFGVASTTVFDDQEIQRTVTLAREAARFGRPLPGFKGLYRTGGPVAELPTYDTVTATIAPAEKARNLRTIFDRGRRSSIDYAGSYTTAAMSVAAGNSHGLRRFCRTTLADATVIAIHPNGSGYATRCDRTVPGLEVIALGEEATSKALLQLDNRLSFEPGQYDVILEPAAIAEVLDWMNMITFSGQAFEDGSSFFVGNVGTQMLSESLTIADDAIDPGFLPFPFDVEGFAKRRVPLVENGTIRTPVVDKAWSDRLGIAPTGNAWHLGAPEHGSAFHLSVAPGHSSREELIRSTERGVWVTRFNYVNGLLEPRTARMTGMTRDGTFLIRDGKIAGRLPNLRWTQSLVEAFSNVEGLTAERRAVGTWYNPFGGTITPAMKIRGWSFTAA